jgi:hypothetical protein
LQLFSFFRRFYLLLCNPEGVTASWEAQDELVLIMNIAAPLQTLAQQQSGMV